MPNKNPPHEGPMARPRAERPCEAPSITPYFPGSHCLDKRLVRVGPVRFPQTDMLERKKKSGAAEDASGLSASPRINKMLPVKKSRRSPKRDSSLRIKPP